MDFNDNTTKIILAIIALVIAIIGGSFISIRRSKNRRNNVRQDNIDVSGDNSKVIGGDDNSRPK
jgi:glucose uptake protein GlcU